MADLPGGEETDLLEHEVKAHKQESTKDTLGEAGMGGACVSSSRRYNDVRRQVKEKLSAHRKQLTEKGGPPPTTTEDLMSAEDIAASTITAESIAGFGGLEVGV
ncbi:hypothetical protein N1851_013930 [Merluccius polli]|uniref:Uncharacterized protein n=1 Tax=Merluccius polli TaxID=89951 RepID=A0AA47MU26_MERPO|nr:hypothetical protein N1851_013930 [Merluccius polli]